MSVNRLEQKSLLIISHSYKPLLNPRAFRWSAILEEWAKDNTKIDVITSWQPGQPREEIINNVHIFRVNNALIEKLRSRFIKTDRKTSVTKNKNSAKTESKTNKVIKTVLKKLHDLTWKNIYWPDYATLWKKTALQNAIYLIDTEQYDAFITVSDPFTSHTVGYELKQKYPQLKWLVDIGDPFCFRHDTPTNNHFLYKQKNYNIEREVFAKAEHISVTTESTKNKYTELFPESAHKIKVIPPLMAPAEVKHTSTVSEKNDTIKLIFVGTLYKAIRNPKFLLQIFTQLLRTNFSKKVELHFYGDINDCQDEFKKYQPLLNKNLFLHGLVSREEVLQAMATSSVLINIGNDNMYQLPSKIVEYVLTGKPIINIARLENDSSTEFLQAYPGKLIMHDTKDGLFQNELSKCISFIHNLPKDLPLKERETWHRTFSPETITKQYQNLLAKPIPECNSTQVLS